MNETDGRRQRGERARAQVLEHATAIASTDGLEGLTIGRVATDAGVGKGNIQVLFGDKETLQLATLDAGVVHYRATVVEPAPNSTSAAPFGTNAAISLARSFRIASSARVG